MTAICHNEGMEDTNDGYQAFTTQAVDIGGDPFQVRVHWAQRDGRLTVVGFDVRAFFSGAEDPAVKAILQGDTGLHFLGGEVTTSALRAVRFADLAEQSRRELLRSLGEAPVVAGEEAERAALAQSVEGTRRAPGPRPVVSDEVLAQVVAPAHARGGRKPVEAVREALEAANLPGLGRTVTREQASKAVQRARSQGLIPAATRRKR